MKKLGIATGLIAILLIGACFALPERFAVNVPLSNMLFGSTEEAPANALLGTRIRAPEGFSVSFFATEVENARFLRFTERGDLLVSQPRRGKILLLERDGDGDGRSDGRRILLEGLDGAQGMDLHGGWLYIAEASAIARVGFDSETGLVTGAVERIATGLPSGGNHWARTLRVGPDARLYVPIGSSCNVCEEEDPRRGALLRFELDGSGEEIVATGIRNSEGLDWQPGTGKLFVTDNGRDLLGDDFPPCELNEIREGGFYGWPYANGDRVPDPDFGPENEKKIRNSIPPAHSFGAHQAPLGMTYIRSAQIPQAYRGAALVALHGSWNRTSKAGYKVVSLHWSKGSEALEESCREVRFQKTQVGDPKGRCSGIEERDFLWGFEVEEDVIGRPVDVVEGPDGAFYISDDFAGSIYRVAYAAASSL